MAAVRRAECGARMDERGFVAVSFVEAADDANAVALEPLEVPCEPRDLERQVVEPFTASGEEAFDEAPRPRTLDELDLVVADGEVGPKEFRRIAVPLPSGTIQPSRKVLEEECERLVDRAYGDRRVIDSELRGRHLRKLGEPGNRVNSPSRLDFRAPSTSVSGTP